MNGLEWTVLIWLVALLAIAPNGFRQFVRTGRLGYTTPQLALVVVLLGTRSFVVSSSADDILRDPVIIERIIRGVFGAAAGLMVANQFLGAMSAKRMRLGPASTAFGMYVLVAIFSVAYSVAPLVSAAKVIELALIPIVVWTIAAAPDGRDRLRETVRMVVLLEAALVITAIVGYFVLPSVFAEVQGRPGFVFEATMVSPYLHENALSAASAVILAYSLATALGESDPTLRRRWFALCGAGVVGMLLASGRQGLAMGMAGVAVVLWFHRRRLFILAIAPLTAFVLAINADAVWGAIARDQNPETLRTWSSRLIWWQAGIDSFMHEPLGGHGFSTGGRFVALRSLSLDVSSLHSGYIEALTGLGLLGIVPLAYAMYRVAAWSVRQLRARADAAEAILIVPLALHTLVSLGFAAWVNEDVALFVLLAALADTSRRLRPATRPARLLLREGGP